MARSLRLAAGGEPTCFVTEKAELACWGNDLSGQLGDGGTAEHRLRPVPVKLASGEPLSGVRAVALGVKHSCALVGGGEVRCWGDNQYGQLGDGTTNVGTGAAPVVFLGRPA